jgi:hypothetical protein
MSFSAFSSFLHKLAFQRSKSQLKNLLFVPDFDFSAFQLKKTAEKQEQTGPKRTEGWDSRRHEGGGGVSVFRWLFYPRTKFAAIHGSAIVAKKTCVQLWCLTCSNG